MLRTQIQIALGIIAVLITTAVVIVYGMQEFETGQRAAAIEVGAVFFETYCSRCHGTQGRGIPGLCPPLNDRNFFDNRLAEVGWNGSMEDYIVSTASGGRITSTRAQIFPGQGVPAMPPFGDTSGGPLREDQIRTIAAFVMNWEEIAQVVEVPAIPEGPTVGTDITVELPQGDAQAGEALTVSLGCTACHTIDPAGVGPYWLPTEEQPGIGDRAEIRITQSDYTGNAADAFQYLFESIVLPPDFLVDGYDNLMPNGYANTLTDLEVGNLMGTSRSFRNLGIAFFLALCIVAVGRVMVSAQTSTETEVLELGARLYNENCAVCHGIDGQGRVGARLAKDWPSIRPDATIRTNISNGIVGSVMPGWSLANGGPLSDSEINAIVAYILSWQTGGIPDFTPSSTATPRPPIEPVPEVEGDPDRGAVLYDENCVLCHGLNGEGRVGTRLAKSWPSVRPDLTVRATIAQGLIGTTMPAWSQAHGGPLTEDEIDDIVAFVLTLPPPTIDDTAAQAAAEPAATSPISGAAGVLLGVVLFTVIVAVILWAQRRN